MIRSIFKLAILVSASVAPIHAEIADFGGYCVQINRSDSLMEKPVPVEWRFNNANDFEFSVPTPMNYEILLTTLRGDVVKSYRGIAREGWQDFDLTSSSQNGACILRIKIGCQLLVAGKIVWPVGKV